MKQRSKVVIEPRIRISCGRNFAFGPGQARLLAEIAQVGSIAVAARTMKMSYMRAWLLVKKMNRGFVEPLVVTVRGGGLRGGANLTATGRRVLQIYQAIEAHSRKAANSKLQRLAALRRA